MVRMVCLVKKPDFWHWLLFGDGWWYTVGSLWHPNLKHFLLDFWRCEREELLEKTLRRTSCFFSKDHFKDSGFLCFHLVNVWYFWLLFLLFKPIHIRLSWYWNQSFNVCFILKNIKNMWWISIKVLSIKTSYGFMHL